MTLRPLASLLVAVLLAGCQSVDVKPAQPSLHIPAQWRAASGPASAPEQLWWRNFHDNNLNRYVDQALKNNSDVLIARERINEYQARVYAADGSLFPSLDAGVTGTRARTQSAATGLPVYSTLYKGSLTASYDVDIWGVNRSTANAAQASLEAQKAAAAAADLTVASSVASGYVTLLSLDEQLRVTESTLKSREEAFNLAKRQEADSTHARVARQNIQLAGLNQRIELIEGPALTSLENFGDVPPFDLIFIDADKPNNPGYLEWALHYSRPGTVIIGDNVVRDGEVINGQSDDARVQGVRRFIEMMGDNPRLTTTALQTVGVKGWDGFTLAIVNG
nr:TolC family protein [Enterobacter cloacae]